MMKYLLLISVFLFVLCKAYPQDINYPVTNYTTKDYGRDYNPTNLAIVQDNRGMIYTANAFNILEYDGSSWKSYRISKDTWILSLASANDGCLYAGSQSEFGYFSPGSRGELKYRSLSDSLDISDLEFTNIWKVHNYQGGIIFQSEEKLFLYSGGIIKTIKPETSFHTSFVVNDRVFVRERGIGLLELNDTIIKKPEGGEIFDTTGVFVMLPLGSNGKNIFIGTREKGFWIFKADAPGKKFSPFIIKDNRFPAGANITCGAITGDGNIALGTMNNGVIIIDTAGNVKSIINTENGLADNDVKDLISDRNNNLWAALNNGISMIGISSPISVYDEKHGITGTINSVIRHGDLIYAGTTTGLFIQSGNNKNESAFKQIAGLPVTVRSLAVAEGDLFAGTDAGLYNISGERYGKIDDRESFTLFYSPALKLLLSGGAKGLSSYRLKGEIEKAGYLNIDKEDIIGIAPDKNPLGADSSFWLGTRINGLLRVRLNKNHSVTTDRYNEADGLPGGWVVPSVIGPKNLFQTLKGLYDFTNEETFKESLADSVKNNKDFAKGFFSVSTDFLKVKRGIVTVLCEDEKKVWICSDNNIGYLDKGDSMKYIDRPFRGIEAAKILTIYPEGNGICWIGTTDGLVRYDENKDKNYDINFSTLIRQINLIETDSVIYMGNGAGSDQGISEANEKLHSGHGPALGYRHNSVRFEFSAPFYEYQAKVLYSYMLEGRNSKWSQWSPENFQDFTDLREGRYTFLVKARNIYGTESKESGFSFTILPPWYRSVAAYIIYVVAGLFILWLFARLYSYRLKRENIRLEGIVTERTAEVVRQKDEILQKNIVLEHQKKEIEDSIRYARRIQSAVLPSEKICHELLPESFVFFRPLNIVSGDFYWISKVGNRIIYTAADCTGHGVPGAFMSMIGVAFLNEIVDKDHITSPDIILSNLREKVIDALQQQGVSGEARDGMDIALVSIDLSEMKLEYAGAYNPLVMIRNREIIEFPGDKMPIGIYENMSGFRKHEIKIEKGDRFYMYSDGYEDQFGGPEGKKFKSKKLKCMLMEISEQPMHIQKEILESKLDEWKGDLPQVDDIVMIGIEIR